MSKVRTRMAPSPTGEYHIGHIRTVLYNYAFSKKNKGKFIIRIEDTDQERKVEGAVDRILDVIKRYGLSWDEGPDKDVGYGPYIQSERLELYKEHALSLIEKDQAYMCFCTKERLDEMRKEQQEKGVSKTMYDGHCRNLTPEIIKENLSKGLPYVIRQKVPKDQNISFDDAVYGHIEFDSNEVDDTVLLKSDGFPTYHLAVVVDDHLMEISHVLRGNDWLPSTPKHVLLYKAFGWDIPIFVHLPNLKEKGENRKLSKRYGSVYALDFLQEGYLTEALLNFLMFLGWNPGTEKEIYSMEEFINDFDLERIHKTDLVAFDREKLLWLNGYYIRLFSPKELHEKLEVWAKDFGIELHTGAYSGDYKEKVAALIQERLKTFSEYNMLTHYFYQAPVIDSALLSSFAKDNNRAQIILKGLQSIYKGVDGSEWKSALLDELSHNFIKENSFSPKEAFMTLRIAVTGEKATPPIFDILELLEKDECIKRIESAAEKLTNIHDN